MSTVAASTDNVYSMLMSCTSFHEACEHNSDMKSWNNDLKTLAEKTLKSHEGGEGLSIGSFKPFTDYVTLSNKRIVEALSKFKEDIMKEEGASQEEKEEKKETVDVLGDQYIKMSSHMMDFLSETERFIMLSRNSHDYVAHVIQQYLETETDKRDAEHYRLIFEKLEELKRSDNVFEHSAEGLLEKAERLIKQHEEMLQKLQDEIKKLELAEKLKAESRNLMYITSMILTGVAIGIIIAGCVAAVVLSPAVAVTIAGLGVVPVGGFAAAWAAHFWIKADMQSMNSRLKRDKSWRDETRVTIADLGDIKSSLESVITAIQSLLYKPNSAMELNHKEDIDFTMKKIEDKLINFLNKINELEKATETCKKDILKARKEIYT